MTTRQIDVCLRKIKIRQHNNRAMQASLHGIKMPMIGVEHKKPDEKLPEVSESLAHNLLLKALEEKRREKNGLN